MMGLDFWGIVSSISWPTVFLTALVSWAMKKLTNSKLLAVLTLIVGIYLGVMIG